MTTGPALDILVTVMSSDETYVFCSCEDGSPIVIDATRLHAAGIIQAAPGQRLVVSWTDHAASVRLP